MEIQRKLLINSLLDVKTYFYFLGEDGFEIKKYCKTLKNVEKQVIYYFFQKKKYIVEKFSVFCLLFDENNKISRK